MDVAQQQLLKALLFLLLFIESFLFDFFAAQHVAGNIFQQQQGSLRFVFVIGNCRFFNADPSGLFVAPDLDRLCCPAHPVPWWRQAFGRISEQGLFLQTDEVQGSPVDVGNAPVGVQHDRADINPVEDHGPCKRNDIEDACAENHPRLKQAGGNQNQRRGVDADGRQQPGNEQQVGGQRDDERDA